MRKDASKTEKQYVNDEFVIVEWDFYLKQDFK